MPFPHCLLCFLFHHIHYLLNLVPYCMKMDPIVSYLLLLSLRWSTHSSVSWTERLTSCFYSSMQRRLNRLSNFSHDNKLLALMDMKGFDPKEVVVTVKDGKVKVLAEHKEEHATTEGKEYNYRSIMKEISLPLGVSKDEVTYSLGPNSIMKIEMACKCYPCLLSRLSHQPCTRSSSCLFRNKRQPSEQMCVGLILKGFGGQKGGASRKTQRWFWAYLTAVTCWVPKAQPEIV
uniref:Outer dense fiber protein 1 n=1 Tax=Strix occidentalis caurina TaxID=311401 RepID=A0A8D0F754_STROC